MKTAILSNVATGVLETLLKEKGEVWSPPGSGSWVETSLSPPAEMISFSPARICILLDRRFGDVAYPVGKAIASLEKFFPGSRIVVPDLEAMARENGKNFYDERMRLLSGSPWSLAGMREIAKTLFPVKKVLAVDLDETLWESLAGEGEVVPRKAFQEKIADLVRRGVLLVALSKNDAADVERAWKTPGMVLSPADFVHSEVNWNEKADNLVSVARKLGLAEDSFVFVDDDPAERAAMREKARDVCVPPFPPDFDVLFPRGTVTAEDSLRSRHYRAEVLREKLSAGKSLEDYLQSLEMRVSVHIMRDDETDRVASLSQRANQFNVRTNRYTAAQVASLARDPRSLWVTMSVSDRFGDLGLVSFVHVRDGEIIDWVMSCRAMNRHLEDKIESFVEEELFRRGTRKIAALWKRSAKNMPSKDLFSKIGFSLVSETEDEKRYERFLG